MNDKDTNSLERLWGEGRIRAFISHKAKDKKLANEIKQCLDSYGIASFVSHEDIEPMKEWVAEIERRPSQFGFADCVAYRGVQ